MGDEVETEIERPLEERRGESVVADRDDLAAAADLRHLCEVDDLQHRVGRRLGPQELRRRPDRRLDPLRVCHVDEGEFDPEALEDLVGDAEGPPVEVVAEDDVIAGVAEVEDGVGRRQSRGERQRVLAAFERGEASLQGIAGRIAGARIFEASGEAIARTAAIDHAIRAIADPVVSGSGLTTSNASPIALPSATRQSGQRRPRTET